MEENLENQLLNACGDGDLDLVKNLINQGADIHTCNDLALRWAVLSGHLDIVKYLEGIILKEKLKEKRKEVWKKFRK